MMQGLPQDRFTRVYLSLWGVLLLAVLTVFVFYKFGFRLTSGFAPVKVTSIELESNEHDLQIFMDNREQRTFFREGRYRIDNVIPGVHSLLVSKKGFWPWTKTVAIEENRIKTLSAFIFPMSNVVSEGVSPGTSEYKMAEEGFRKAKLPEPLPGSVPYVSDQSLSEWLDTAVPRHIISADKTTGLYVRDDAIYVAWVSETEAPPHYFCVENPCKFVMLVTVSSQPVRSIDFYRNRADIVLFAAGTSIYAIEVSREGTQNFQPLYKGNEPYFYQTPEGVLYIKDRNFISRVTL